MKEIILICDVNFIGLILRSRRFLTPTADTRERPLRRK